MVMQAKIIGVHPFEAPQPVHLIELFVEGDVKEFDFGEITQELVGQPRTNWQVPWDERLLEESDGKARYAFFFHYLDLTKQLLTLFGPLQLPQPTKAPVYLDDFEYESPS